ncbi:hypothetical protein BXZ70DRAFT_211146 [Cristinia sonorae]|uniref:Uncharacterized protein n=1 Tax=Cristinia sonorae TaxID=1940300 RepID=A0A8K0UP20_9AGAR|nr:hypothetical protein BXZ70DRAFT_211146 [Cristinia sonorae]
MLSLIKNTAARAWEATSQNVLGLEYSGEEEDPVLSTSVEELCDYIPSIAWHRLAEACTSTVAPVCNAVRSTVHNDIDSLARLLADLDDNVMTELELSPSQDSAPRLLNPATSTSLRPSTPLSGNVICMEQCSSASGYHENPDHGIPTIVITPCASQPRDRTGWVPFQDASFGNRLVVPTHPVVNDVFPPLIAKVSPMVERWQFVDGHWWALLPSPEEQMQRGMFSRPMHRQRRKSFPDSRSKRHPPRSRPPSPSLRAINSP